MIVTTKNFARIIKSFSKRKYLVIDCETTGLYWQKKDKLFSFAISTFNNEYYFNFNKQHPNCLSKEYIKCVLDHFNGTIIGHNLKFDAFFLLKENLDIRKFEWYDSMVAQRVLRNDEKSLSLDALTGEKDNLKIYCNKRKLYTNYKSPYAKKSTKIYHYDKIPYEIIMPYCCNDARITKKLAIKQISSANDSERKIIKMEMRLLKAVFDMELRGIKVDNDFISEAIKFYTNEKEKYRKLYEEKTGFNDPAARKNLILALEVEGYNLPISKKGNPTTDKKALENLEGDLPEIIKKWRDADKRLCTYYGGYDLLKTKSNNIHYTFHQEGAKSRCSSSKPNLQNVHKKDKSIFPVRKCFIPREGYVFICIDYDAMEMKKVYDLCGEKEIIESIKKGLDVHEAIGNKVGLSRDKAKTMNYGILFGMGIKKLADDFKCSIPKAKEIKLQYFKGAPKVASFIQKVIDIARFKGYILNWYGRKYYFDKDDPKVAVSRVIQGGCNDIVKLAMVEISDFIKNFSAHLVLQVHDELVFEIHKDDLHIVPKLKEIMEKAYPYIHLPLTCSVEIAEKNWNDRKKILDRLALLC